MYARPGFGMITPAVKNLVLSNVAIFLVQILWPYLINARLFGLVPALVITKLTIWQFVTYMFLHGNFSHILFNMFALWIFGIDLERSWGTREFIKYYFLTGIVAGFTTFLWNLSGPGAYIPTIGASGAIFGVLAAYALFFPDREIYIYFLFPVKAKYFVLIYGVLELLMLPNSDGVSHISHLGGMVAGFFYLRYRYRHAGIGQGLFRNFFKKKGDF